MLTMFKKIKGKFVMHLLQSELDSWFDRLLDTWPKFMKIILGGAAELNHDLLSTNAQTQIYTITSKQS